MWKLIYVITDNIFNCFMQLRLFLKDFFSNQPPKMYLCLLLSFVYCYQTSLFIKPNLISLNLTLLLCEELIRSVQPVHPKTKHSWIKSIAVVQIDKKNKYLFFVSTFCTFSLSSWFFFSLGNNSSSFFLVVAETIVKEKF